MKNIYSILGCAALLFALLPVASCNKEPIKSTDVKNSGKEELHYTLTIGLDDTKATIGEPENSVRKMSWNTGDVISVNGFKSEPLASDYDGKNKATFEFDSSYGDAPYLVCYGCTYTDATHIVLPYVQTGADGANKAKDFPMAAYVEKTEYLSEDKLVLHQLCGFINTKITGSGSLRFVEFSAGEAQLSGSFTISFNKDGIPTLEAGGISSPLDRKVRVNCAASLSETECNCIIAVPAGTYSTPTLRFITGTKVTDGKYYDSTSYGSKTVTRGSIKNFTAAFDTSTPTGNYAEITSAADWNAFAKYFNDNEYGDDDPLVSIANDIDFENVVPTLVGSYGDDNAHYFNAVIEGNSHSFKNLKSSYPLIAALDPDGAIKHLTIDSTCSFTPAFDNSRGYHFGTFCEYLKGTLSECVNYASIELNPEESTTYSNDNYVGGIAGRIREGKINDCTNYGTITLGTNYTVSSSDKTLLCVGGIVGWISNNEGSIQNSTNKGQINVSSTADPLVIGGIAGKSAGKISSCENAKELNVSTARASGDPCKNIYFGGITGQETGGSITSCNNTAALTTTSNVKLQNIGGITGFVDGGTIEKNTNSGDITSSKKARQLLVGGIIGTINALGDYKFTGTPATGAITISDLDATASILQVGGLVGRVTYKLNGDVKIIGENLESSCNINLNVSSEMTMNESGLGGILGAAGLDAGDNTATTTVSIDKCNVSSGDVNVTLLSKVCFKSSALGMGGILGNSVSQATIENCSAANTVQYSGISGNPNSNGFIVECGGIAGRITGANSTISSCTVTKQVYNQHYNNNAVSSTTGNATGGIIGSFGHVSDNSATISITNCTSSASVYAYRCCAGGIAGFLSNATVKGCSVTGAISNGNYAGGLVGYASASTFGGTADGEACTFNCADGIKSTNAGSCMNYAGGLAGQTVSSCKFINCGSYFGTTNGNNAQGTKNGNAPGSLIGNSDAKTTVTSCKAGGLMQAETYGMPGASTIKSAKLDATTVLSYAVGNQGFTPTSGNISLWDGK